jgi:clan AA aspartic protease
MITGRVEDRHALLSVVFSLQGRPSVSIEFVVDTGFTDALCLPSPAVTALGLPFQFDFPASLADGSQVLLPVHEATIVWDGVEQRVHVLATGNRPLIGTALMDGTELLIQFIEGGMVSVEAL